MPDESWKSISDVIPFTCAGTNECILASTEFNLYLILYNGEIVTVGLKFHSRKVSLPQRDKVKIMLFVVLAVGLQSFSWPAAEKSKGVHH